MITISQLGHNKLASKFSTNSRNGSLDVPFGDPGCYLADRVKNRLDEKYRRAITGIHASSNM